MYAGPLTTSKGLRATRKQTLLNKSHCVPLVVGKPGRGAFHKQVHVQSILDHSIVVMIITNHCSVLMSLSSEHLCLIKQLHNCFLRLLLDLQKLRLCSLCMPQGRLVFIALLSNCSQSIHAIFDICCAFRHVFWQLPFDSLLYMFKLLVNSIECRTRCSECC